MNTLLKIAVAILPDHLRDRYREEWSSDLALAATVGLRPRHVAWGALATSVKLAGAPSPQWEPSLSRRWIHRDVAAWVMASIGAAGVAGMMLMTSNNQVSVPALILIMAVIAGCAAMAGQRAQRLGASQAFAVVMALFLADSLAFLLVGGAFLIFSALMTLIGPAIAIVVLIVLGFVVRPSQGRSRPILVACLVLFGLLVTAGSAFDALVLAPSAMRPGVGVADTYAALAADGGLDQVVFNAVVWTCATAVALVLLGGMAVRKRWSARTIMTLAAAMVFGIVMTSRGLDFIMGFAVAEAMPAVNVEVSTPLYGYLLAVAAVSIATAAALGLAPRGPVQLEVATS